MDVLVEMKQKKIFADTVLERYADMLLGEDDDCDFENTLYSKTFVSPLKARLYREYVLKQLEHTQNKNNVIVLPPLFLRSSVSCVFKIHNVLVVAHENGPMIPVVTNQKTNTKILKTLYALHSGKPMDSDAFRKLLCLKK